MKPRETKSCRKGAFYGWQYAGALAGIARYSTSRNEGNEEILLPAQIVCSIEFGNLRFSIPPEAILTMQVLKKQESHGGEFQSQYIMVEQEIMRSPAISPVAPQPHAPDPKQENPKEAQEKQKLVEHVLALKDALFREIAERIAPLPADATPEQRVAKLQELFNLLKKNGGLGILYEPSEERKPKTPNKVLTPEKDGTRKADCDEFSLLFFAAVKRLNIDVSDVGIGVMKFEAENVLGDKKEEMHAAALIVGNDKYLIDPVFGFFQKVSSFEIKEIQPLYKEKLIDERFKIVGILDLEIAGTPEQMAAIHYREMANYYVRRTENSTSGDRTLLLGRVRSTLEDISVLAPNIKSLPDLARKYVAMVLDDADARYARGDLKTAAKKYSEIINWYTNNPALLADEDSKKDFYYAMNNKARIHIFNKRPDLALLQFDEMIESDPRNPVAYENKIGLLQKVEEIASRLKKDNLVLKYNSEIVKTAEKALAEASADYLGRSLFSDVVVNAKKKLAESH